VKKAVDQKLITQGICSGNRQIFSQFFMHTNKKVYYQCLQFGLDHEDAEEVVQEVYLTIWRKRNELKTEFSLDAYLYKIAQSFIFKSFRRKAYQIAYENFKKSEVFNSSDQITQILEYQELDSFLQELIDEMPAKRKEIFKLSRQHHLSHAEIAERLNISIRTVEGQIHKAIKYLKGRLIESEV